ncbi:vWA domain-containing protein [Streptomyces lichenis]|uniref:von Willebrand factor type A domain-containing protein n=1 Tax=Streptomyces lichenis TaxID=2306967 RepID=A0ABT0I5D4_9ACTN|nr:von Willebrand factor type A domain-containing protein [Streptomyces lichenis]MCK8676511.1 von Willebrand factor type A domain-containing protein [Streptomyces lichenis]
MRRRTTTPERMGRRPRATAVALLAAALLLGGCSGGQDGTGTADRAARKSGGGSSGAYAPPAPNAPQDGKGGPAGRDSGGGADEPFRAAPPAELLSTFALDVDTASYGYARRVLADGRLPDRETVRPEEFVNTFRQDYPQPEGSGFTVTVDGARTKAGDWSLVRVGMATRTADRQGPRPPAALTFVVDISGSMGDPGRLDLVKESLGVLTGQLRDDDSVALVTFSDEAEVRLPMTPLKGNRERVRETVSGLEVSASTNVAAGVRTGYDTAVAGHRAGATNRVVLLSDALANTGETDAQAILERIEGDRREHGITLFGVGVGSEYGDALMEQLADRGDGHTTYVSTPEQARKVFVDQLPAHVELRARDAKAQVAFDPDRVEEFRLVGYENRKVADEDFRDDRVDGGEVGPGHQVTALYAVRTRPGADTGRLAEATVRWLDPATRAPREQSGALDAKALAPALWSAETAPGLRVAAAAGYFGDSLRGGELPGAPSPGELADLADGLARTTESEVVAELADSVRRANQLRG